MEKNIRMGVALCKLRFDKGLSINDLAKASGVSPEVIFKLENGQFDLQEEESSAAQEFLRLCQTLGTDEENLVKISKEIMPTDPVEAKKRLDSLYARS